MDLIALLKRIFRPKQISDAVIIQPRTDYDDQPTQVLTDNLSLTLWGMPTGLNKNQQEEIFNNIVAFCTKKHERQSFAAGQIIEAQEFTVRLGDQLYRLRYQLKALRFLVALEIYQGALKWLSQNPEMDGEVARITQAYLLRELHGEYTRTVGKNRILKLNDKDSDNPLIIELHNTDGDSSFVDSKCSGDNEDDNSQ